MKICKKPVDGLGKGKEGTKIERQLETMINVIQLRLLK
jgi:hypothetical protein